MSKLTKYNIPINFTVYCAGCEERVPVVKVKFLNVEEDIQGRDIMTFKCSFCGEDHKGMVYRE
jgi:hypothetical protein